MSNSFHKLPFGSVMLDSDTTCDTAIIKSVVCNEYLCLSKIHWGYNNGKHTLKYYITRKNESPSSYNDLFKNQDGGKTRDDHKNLITATSSPKSRYLYNINEYEGGGLVAKDTPWIQIGDRIIDKIDIRFNKCDDKLCITQVGYENTIITYKNHDKQLYERLSNCGNGLRPSKVPNIKLSNLSENRLPAFYGMTPVSFTRTDSKFTINYRGCNFQNHKMHLTQQYLNRD